MFRIYVQAYTPVLDCCQLGVVWNRSQLEQGITMHDFIVHNDGYTHSLLYDHPPIDTRFRFGCVGAIDSRAIFPWADLNHPLVGNGCVMYQLHAKSKPLSRCKGAVSMSIHGAYVDKRCTRLVDPSTFRMSHVHTFIYYAGAATTAGEVGDPFEFSVCLCTSLYGDAAANKRWWRVGVYVRPMTLSAVAGVHTSFTGKLCLPTD